MLRHDWTVDETTALLTLPLDDLVDRAAAVHAENFDTRVIEAAMLLSIKTGGCPEDCAYCPQAARWQTDVEPQRLMGVEEIVDAARGALAAGAVRFCLGAAWRSPNDRQVAQVAQAITAVAALGLQTCATLGMLTTEQAEELAAAGLGYYNHNLDTSPEYYATIITTRTYQDRLDTLARVREAGIKVCCGGIVGMGESQVDRAGLLVQLANLDPHPESVPINLLVQVPGVPLHGTEPLDPVELVRTIAAARLMMPSSVVRLSAGRVGLSADIQALCFGAGANSIFLGDRLLTTPNNDVDEDRLMLDQLGLRLAAAPILG